jgi:hypothetical protein
MNFKEYENLPDFLSENENEINNNFHFNLFVYKILDSIKTNQISYETSFKIKYDNTSINCIWNIGIIALFGENRNIEKTNELLSQCLQLKKFKPNAHFVGERNIVENLFRFQQIKYKIYKHRLFYNLNVENFKPSYNFENIYIPNESDSMELTDLHNLFSISDLNKELNIDSMFNVTKSTIQKGNIFCIKDNNKIVSTITIMYEKKEDAMFGEFYTLKEYRNNKLGETLLEYCIMNLKKRLCKNIKMTIHEDNIPMNKIAKKYNFELKNEYIEIITE